MPLFFVSLLVACGGRSRKPGPPITVFAAASLAQPLAALTQAYLDGTGTVVQRELGGSVEHARKLTELGRIPDVLLLADDDVLASLMPAHIDWYARFATTRLVIAYTERSIHADSISAENWWAILSADGVRVGRGDSVIAPVGRQALSLLRRAETYYDRPGLAEQLRRNAAARFVRPNAADLAVLLETGEVDYIIEYEAVARQHGLKYVTLPLDLATPVLYGVSVPKHAPNAAEARRFVQFMLSADGRRIMNDAGMELLPLAVAIGTNIPPGIAALVRTATDAR